MIKIAVCFYGITRCLHRTLPGIEENLLGPLRDAGADCSIFLHCLTLKRLTNERSGEHDCELDEDEWTSLCAPGPNALAEPQERVDQQLEHELYQRQPDPWNDSYASSHNYVRSLYSQGRALTLIPDPLSFDLIICARPDILYSEPFDPAWLPPQRKKPTIHVPAFAAHGGINDRFAVGSPAAMILYMRRGYDYKALHLASQPGQHKKLTGEKYLKSWVRYRRIKVRRIPWTFARIRANGKVAEWDLKYVPRDSAC